MAKFGRYQVIKELKQGGMATVYHAFDPLFERDVAIKVLPAGFLHDPSFRTRFEREAKTIASLEHPAIVPVYDFGEQDGQPYIVMRFMAGGSLSDRLENEPLSLNETTKIVSRLAPALDAAHVRGIVHRDIKPGNILFDQYGNAFLSDFGIARLAEQSSATITGENVVGTPTYMSPEQAYGDKSIDGKSDIYSLGVLIYQMLTGQPPFRADTPAKTMMMHIIDPPPNASDITPDLPMYCDEVIIRAMAKESHHRFNSVSELAAQLDKSNINNFVQTTTGSTKVVSDSNTPSIINIEDQTIQQPFHAPEKQNFGIASAQPARKIGRILPVYIVPILIFSCIILIISTLILISRQHNFPEFASIINLVIEPTHTPKSLFNPTGESELPENTPTVTFFSKTLEPVTPTLKFETITVVPSDIPKPLTPTFAGADKIAYLFGNDIWVANIDGSDAFALTDDKTTKSNLQWTPDGKSIIYILGKCIQIIDIESTRVDTVVCFNFIDYLRAFEISPDSTKVAISLDNQLYIVPYDLDRFADVKIRSDLTEMAECKEFAPYEKNFVKRIRWGKDSQTIAAVIIGVGSTGAGEDVVRVIDLSRCAADAPILDHFPGGSRFTIKDYEKNPEIQNFTWDGLYLFALTSAIRNGGFGDLYVYNMELHKGKTQVNPIENTCCYRDPVWSPDGSHLLIAYQDINQGGDANTELYFIHYGTIGTGLVYTPIPLPIISDLKAKPEPVLRPVVP